MLTVDPTDLDLNNRTIHLMRRIAASYRKRADFITPGTGDDGYCRELIERATHLEEKAALWEKHPI